MSARDKRGARRWLWVSLLLVGMTVTAGGRAQAATFGVPTNLNADGTTSGTSVNPPGWFILSGTDTADANGDTVHQLRLFIEVSGTTLDIKIFDPGDTGARDNQLGQGTSNTRYRLLNPAGAAICTVTFGNDNATTENRLARLSSGCAFVAANASTSFSGLTAGLYTLEVRRENDNASNNDANANSFGVDIRDGTGNSLAAYTIGNSDATTTGANAGATETSMLVGASGDTNPFGSVTNPMIMYPYVNRGCVIQTSNYDGDASGSASLTDTRGTATTLTMSAGTTHVENGVTAENAAAVNLESNNYGLYTLLNNTGTQQNLTDWRVGQADVAPFWNSNGAALPPNATSPMRIYLPTSYSIAGGVPSGVAPLKPIVSSSTRVVSGPNPPVVGSATRFLITATVDNPTSSDLTSVQITIPIVANAAFIAGTEAGFIDGVAAACVTAPGAGFRRCTFATLNGTNVGAVDHAATLNIEVNYTPAGAGLQNITGPPVAGAPPPNTTVWAQYTPVYTSVALTTETLGPACNLVVTVGGVALATRASVRGLRVDPAGRVEFVTSAQHDTVAFNLYATDPTGRVSRVPLTARPVAAIIRDSDRPLLYRVDTAPIKTSHLMIEEIDGRGRRRLIGPFEIGEPRLAAAVERAEAQLDEENAPQIGHVRVGRARAAARVTAGFASPKLSKSSRVSSRGGLSTVRGSSPDIRGGRKPPPGEGASEGVRITVDGPARVQVSFADLWSAGLPPGTPTTYLHLATAGREVPFEVVPGSDSTPSAILFEAERRSTAYTGHNVYVLTWGALAPPPAVPFTPMGPPVPAGFDRVDKNTIYVANAPPEADPWQWDLLFGDGSTWPYASEPDLGTFDLPGLVPSPFDLVAVRLHLLGRSSHRHIVSAAINGASIGEVVFTGAVSATLEGAVRSDALQPSGNQLTITYTADVSDDVGLIYVDSLDLAVSRTGGPVTSAREVVPYLPEVPSFAGVDYLVVTHALFQEQAERIASIQESRGHKTVVVDVERAYDSFSAGITEAAAVGELIRRAAGAEGSALRYVLLVGDDTFDTHDYLGTGAVAFVPSLLAFDGEFGRVPSENLYADVDGDSLPDVAIGRLPAQTVAEAAVLADKIVTNVPTSSMPSQLVAVDNMSPSDVSFRAAADAAATLFPAGGALTWADESDGVGQARDTLLDGLRAGTAVVHYFGHAGPDLWSDESLLTVDDAPDLAGTQAPTVLFTWACEAQWYQGLFGPSINEALLLAPQGGAVASFGPAGITSPALQRPFFLATYRQLFGEGLPLGEAIRRAKRQVLAASSQTRPVVEGWNLLGDPALRIVPGGDAGNGGSNGSLKPERRLRGSGNPKGQARPRGAGGSGL